MPGGGLTVDISCKLLLRFQLHYEIESGSIGFGLEMLYVVGTPSTKLCMDSGDARHSRKLDRMKAFTHVGAAILPESRCIVVVGITAF